MSKSMRLTLADVRKVFRLLMECRDLQHDPVACQKYMVEQLCRMIGARQGSAVVFEDYLPQLDPKAKAYVLGGWPDPQTLAHLAAWGQKARFKDDVFCNTILNLPGQVRTVVSHELIDPQVWRSSPLYEECAGPGKIEDVVTAYFHLDEPYNAFGISFHRTRDERTLFEPHHRRVLHLFIKELYLLYSEGNFSFLAKSTKLSGRQRQLLSLILEGRAPKAIAADLRLSIHTVRTYIRDLYRNLGVQGRAELMARYSRWIIDGKVG